MPRECETCESAITPAFARVLGDNDGKVRACPECAPRRLKRYDRKRLPKPGARPKDYGIDLP